MAPDNPPTPFQMWNQRFASEDYLFGTEPNAFLAAQGARLKPGQTALAVADGEGRNGVWLASQGLDVLSVDFSPNAQGKAQRLAAKQGVTLRTETVDLFAWDFGSERFDVVAAIFIQFATPAQRPGLFAKIKRCLKPGGLLLLQGYTPKQVEYKTGGPPNPEHMYTEAMLREAFADMTILHLAEHEDWIEEGSGHKGKSALIDLVAQK